MDGFSSGGLGDSSSWALPGWPPSRMGRKHRAEVALRYCACSSGYSSSAGSAWSKAMRSPSTISLHRSTFFSAGTQCACAGAMAAAWWCRGLSWAAKAALMAKCFTYDSRMVTMLVWQGSRTSRFLRFT